MASIPKPGRPTHSRQPITSGCFFSIAKTSGLSGLTALELTRLRTPFQPRFVPQFQVKVKRKIFTLRFNFSFVFLWAMVNSAGQIPPQEGQSTYPLFVSMLE